LASSFAAEIALIHTAGEKYVDASCRIEKIVEVMDKFVKSKSI